MYARPMTFLSLERLWPYGSGSYLRLLVFRLNWRPTVPKRVLPKPLKEAVRAQHVELYTNAGDHSATYEACIAAFERTWGICKVDRSGRFNIKNLERKQ